MKKTSRRVPYRVFKKFFPDCKHYDYSDGKITVDLPEEYLNDSKKVPDDYRKGGNYCFKYSADGNAKVEIRWYTDVITYYEADYTYGRTKKGIYNQVSLDKTVEWCNTKLTEYENK